MSDYINETIHGIYEEVERKSREIAVLNYKSTVLIPKMTEIHDLIHLFCKQAEHKIAPETMYSTMQNLRVSIDALYQNVCDYGGNQ